MLSTATTFLGISQELGTILRCPSEGDWLYIIGPRISAKARDILEYSRMSLEKVWPYWISSSQGRGRVGC